MDFVVADEGGSVDPIRLVLLYEGAKRLWERGEWPEDLPEDEGEAVNILYQKIQPLIPKGEEADAVVAGHFASGTFHDIMEGFGWTVIPIVGSTVD